ncbi:MAG: hypothetical protein ACI4DU_03885 [Lachnospiraceae bacterium]
MAKYVEELNDYADLYEIEYPKSKKHPQMTMHDRAAQFAPFAALTGHDAAIAEAGRLVQIKHILADDKKCEIDETLHRIQLKLQQTGSAVGVKLTYYEEDGQKDGGIYKTVVARIGKIDVSKAAIGLTSGDWISVENIYEIEMDS